MPPNQRKGKKGPMQSGPRRREEVEDDGEQGGDMNPMAAMMAMMGGAKKEGEKEDEKGDEMNPMAAMMAMMMGGQKDGQQEEQKERNPMSGFMEMMMQGGDEDEASSDVPDQAEKGSAPHPNEAQIEADMASIMAMMGGSAPKMNEPKIQELPEE